MKKFITLLTFVNCSFVFLSDVYAPDPYLTGTNTTYVTYHTQHAGHSCRIYDYQGGDTSLTPSGTKANGLKNSGSSNVTVVCDLHNESSPLSVAGLLRYSKPSSNSPDMDCDLYIRRWDASEYFVEDGSATNYTAHTLWTASWDQGTAKWVHANLYCSLPPNYEILNYSVTVEAPQY